MSEAWIESWEKHKDAAAEGAHIAWMEAKISHGYADHQWSCLGSAPNTCATVDGCTKHHDLHHADMIPFADLSPEIKQYDYDTAIIGFRYGYEAGVKTVLSEMDARGMYP